jgi:hypothetical protein
MIIKVYKLEITILTVDTPHDSLYTRNAQSTEVLMLVYTSHTHGHASVNVRHGEVLYMHPTEDYSTSSGNCVLSNFR